MPGPNHLFNLLGYQPPQNALANQGQPQFNALMGLLGAPPVSAQAPQNLLNFGGDLMRRPLAPANSLVQPTLGGLLGTGLEMAPGTGDAMAMLDFQKANQTGDRWGAALAGASMVPGIGDLAVAAKGLLGAKGAMSGLGLLGQTVFHGSPHDFDAFKLDKIGTGEGAQAYGHGVYLAESPDVARQYAGPLSAARATQPVGNVDLTQLYQSMPNDVPDNLLAARRDFRELQGMGELSAADRRDYLKAVQNNIVGGKGGNLYTADLPDEQIANMLDWDAPLSQQPENIERIRRALVGKDSPLDRVKQFELNDLLSDSVRMENLTPKQVMDLNDPAITERLAKSGIPGIKYLDQGSRGSGKGTRNFVLFDESLAKITKKE